MLKQNHITYTLTLLPFIYITFNSYYNSYIINPFSYLITSSGFIALTLLIVIIIIPIINYLKTYLDRRILGLMTFFYTSMHLVIYIFDNNISAKYLLSDVLNLFYIQSGYLAFILFLPLVFTSTVTSKLRLKNNWFKIHKLIYLIITLSFIHYYSIIKADYLVFIIYLFITSLILLFKQRIKAR